MEFPVEILKTLGSLVLVLGLLLGGLYALRRWGQKFIKGSGTGRIDILERRYLGPKHSLLLVRVAEETLLLGLSPQGLTYLTAVGLEGTPTEKTPSVKDEVR
ncbi:MAG: flagellar biosynthetic protein FliO [Desulfosoma sp.]